MQQRRQEDEEDDVGIELEVRQAGDQADREPADDEHDRVRERDRSASRTSTAAAPSSRIRNSMSPTARATLGSPPRARRLTPPLGPDDHVDGPARRAARARHVRRLPVPVLHRRAADPAARARPSRRPAALRVPALPAARAPPRRRARRGGERGGRRAGRVLADARRALRLRGRLGLDDLVAAARRSGSTPSGSAPSSRPARTRRGCRPTSGAARPAASRARRRSSSTACATSAPSTRSR